MFIIDKMTTEKCKELSRHFRMHPKVAKLFSSFTKTEDELKGFEVLSKYEFSKLCGYCMQLELRLIHKNRHKKKIAALNLRLLEFNPKQYYRRDYLFFVEALKEIKRLHVNQNSAVEINRLMHSLEDILGKLTRSEYYEVFSCLYKEK